MKTTTLKNSFHNTQVKIDARWEELSREWGMPVLSVLEHLANDKDESAKRTLRRVRKTLCGMGDCCCGTVR